MADKKIDDEDSTVETPEESTPAPQTAEPDVVDQVPPAPADTAPQSVAPIPAPAAPQAAAEMPLPPAPPTAQDYNAHDMQNHIDAASQKITPQTYASMFADKSTLGKVGTLFGLMLSGAGSGLAHQSNALLDMMNKQISNDLEAQKATVGNAQNFLNLSYNHELQQAQIRRQDYQNALEQYKAQTQPSAIALTKAQTKQAEAGAQAQQAATAAQKVATQAATLGLAKKKYEAGIFGNLTNPSAPNQSVMPAGGQTPPPQAPGQQSTQVPIVHPNDVKQAAVAAPFRAKNHMAAAIMQNLSAATANNPQGRQVLTDQVAPAVENYQVQNNKQLEAAQKLASPELALLDDPMTDQNRYNQMVTIGRQMPDAPANFVDKNGQQLGSIPPADASQIMQERQGLKQNRQLSSQYVDTFKKLQLLKNAGQMPAGQLMKSIAGTGGAALGALISSAIGQPIAGAVAGATAGEGLGSLIENAFERERKAIIGPLEQQLGIKADSILPSWVDSGTSPKSAFESGMNLFKYKDAGIGQVMNNYGLKSNFPNIPFQEPLLKSPKSSAKENMSVSGLPKLPLTGEGD